MRAADLQSRIPRWAADPVAALAATAVFRGLSRLHGPGHEAVNGSPADLPTAMTAVAGEAATQAA